MFVLEGIFVNEKCVSKSQTPQEQLSSTLGFLPCYTSYCWFQNECFNPVLCLVFCRANRSLSTSFLRAQMSIFTFSYPVVRISLIYYLDKNSSFVTWHVINELVLYLVWKLVISRLSLQSCPIIHHVLFFFKL